MSAHLRSMRTNGECRVKYAAAELAKFTFYIIQGFTNAPRKKLFLMAKGGINIF